MPSIRAILIANMTSISLRAVRNESRSFSLE